MTDYRKARTQFIRFLVVAFLSIAGVQSAVALIPEIPKTLLGGISSDLVRIAFTSLILYGSYNLRLEWKTLKPEERSDHWRTDYRRLQLLAGSVIFVAFCAEQVRNFVYDSGTLKMLWVSHAWGAGFIVGLLIASYKVELLRPIRFAAWLIIVGNFFLVVTIALATKQYTHIGAFFLVALWSYCSFWYFPVILYYEQQGSGDESQLVPTANEESPTTVQSIDNHG